MTEDEAKTKWCPFARTRGFGTEAAVNRPFPGNDGDIVRDECPCIASACMAWRWATAAIAARTEEAETGTDTPRVKIAPPAGEGWIGYAAGRDKPDRPGARRYRWVSWQREIPAVPGEGFCGLAGASHG